MGLQEGMGLGQIKYLPQSQCLDKFYQITTFGIAFYQSNLSTILSNSAQEQYSCNPQPFLNPLSMSRASSHSLQHPSTTSKPSATKRPPQRSNTYMFIYAPFNIVSTYLPFHKMGSTDTKNLHFSLILSVKTLKKVVVGVAGLFSSSGLCSSW